MVILTHYLKNISIFSVSNLKHIFLVEREWKFFFVATGKDIAVDITKNNKTIEILRFE